MSLICYYCSHSFIHSAVVPVQHAVISCSFMLFFLWLVELFVAIPISVFVLVPLVGPVSAAFSVLWFLIMCLTMEQDYS